MGTIINFPRVLNFESSKIEPSVIHKVVMGFAYDNEGVILSDQFLDLF